MITNANTHCTDERECHKSEADMKQQGFDMMDTVHTLVSLFSLGH